MENGTDTDIAKLVCPVCGKETDSIKYRVNIRIAFFIVFFTTNTSRHFLCPHCLRKEIFKTLLLNILTCHILFLMAFLIFIITDLPQLLLSFKRGHSPRLQKVIASENA